MKTTTTTTLTTTKATAAAAAAATTTTTTTVSAGQYGKDAGRRGGISMKSAVIVMTITVLYRAVSETENLSQPD